MNYKIKFNGLVFRGQYNKIVLYLLLVDNGSRQQLFSNLRRKPLVEFFVYMLHNRYHIKNNDNINNTQGLLK